MKRVAACIMFVILAWNCVSKQRQVLFMRSERLTPIVVSVQVGEAINSDERDRFGLFPAVDGFKEARFFSTQDFGCELEIVTETGTLVSVNHDRDAVIKLRDYIDKYEEREGDRTEWESTWGIVNYDALGIPISMNEVAFVKQQYRRQAVRGGVTCCLISSLSGAVLGVVIAASFQDASNEESYYSFYAIGAGLLLGLVGGARRFLATMSDADAIEVIRESRKPRVVESR